MENKFNKALARLNQNVLKMQALNLDEIRTFHKRQRTVSAYQALNYILLYNSSAIKNKSVIPKKYRIPKDKFQKLYTRALIATYDKGGHTYD